jgi:enediyne biosynthesis protein E4
MIQRRRFLGVLGMSAMNAALGGRAYAQGVATRTVRPQPRGKPSGIPFDARFTDVAAEAGLTSPVIYGGTDRKDYILETIGCGCAFVDYDNDGWVDIFILNGTRVEGAPPGTSNRLYKNNRDGTFTDVTERAGLVRTGWASAVTVGDYNNDGHEDLFITYWGQNVLYRNNGDGTFTDVTREAGLLDTGQRWGAGCTFFDYDLDGNLDLFVSNYLGFSFDQALKPGQNANCRWKGVPVNCGPRGLPPGVHALYRSNGNGTFTDVSAASGVAAAKGSYGMGVIAADVDNDGWPDIYVACDSTPSLLFMNNRDGTFREEALIRGVALSEDGLEQAGMGVAFGDVNLDGYADLFKTHFADDTNVLYRADAKGNFTDATRAARIGVETRFVGWGAGIVDLDNDGLPDVFMVTGHVYPEIERALPAYPLKTPRIVFRNLGEGQFEELIEEAGPGVAAAHASRGCAFGDFDNDGDIDIVIVNLNEPPSLLRNDVKSGRHWLKVKLVGRSCNRSAIGARVIARYGGKQQVQDVLAQSGFYSADERRLHFGLGTATQADLEIRWPGGGVQRLPQVKADQVLVVEQPASA